MPPYPISLSLTLLMIAISCFVFYSKLNIDIRRNLFLFKYPIILSIIAMVSISLLFYDKIFFGQEYEDAYIYNSCARYLAEGENNAPLNAWPYFTQTCTIGSVKQCLATSTYTGLIGYVSIIYLGIKLFGYNPYLASLISILFWFLSIITVVISSFLINRNAIYVWFSCFIFPIIPLYSAYSSSTFSEMTSQFTVAFVIMTFLYLSDEIKYSRSNKHLRILFIWTANLSGTLFSISVRRENIVLPIILASYVICVNIIDNWRQKIFNVYHIALQFSILIISLIFYINFIKIIDFHFAEQTRLCGPAFSFYYIIKILPSIFKLYFTFRWFLIFTVWFVIGLIFSYKNRICVLLATLFTFYIIIYSIHYRNPMFIINQSINYFDLARYSVNIMPIYILLVGHGIYSIYYILKSRVDKILQKKEIKYVLLLLCLSFMIVANKYSYEERLYFCSNEYIERLEAVLEMKHIIDKPNNLIITDQNILYQLFYNSNILLMDFFNAKTDQGKNILRKIFAEEKKVYLIIDKHNTVMKINQIINPKYNLDFAIKAKTRNSILYELKYKSTD